ncbi:cytochrome P450 [Sphaerisporangium flaviroseum]|uniref:Cytochrome P450 n=1 Tax=Sphaerisporangium flaviroseum TaxID=509199 RepID=A0ABP7J7I8_9ACTN
MNDRVEPDLTAPGFLAHPHPVLEELRVVDPVQYNEQLRSWLVLSGPEVEEGLRSPHLSADAVPAFMSRLPDGERRSLRRLEDFFRAWMVFSDPPDQQRVRRAFAGSFTARAVQAYIPDMRQRADRLVAALGEAEGRTVDLVTEFARPYAADVTCLALGIADDARAAVQDQAGRLLAFIATPEPRADLGVTALAALDAIGGHVADRLARDRTDDLLVAGAAEGRLSELEVVAAFAQLLTGGVDPLTHAVAAALHQLPQAGFPEEVRRQRLWVEESLRMSCPFRFVPRVAREDLKLGSRLVPAGDRVLLLLTAANRDPATYVEPHAFDGSRSNADRHLTFGRGGHYCLGAPITREALRTAVQAACDAGWTRAVLAGPVTRRSSDLGTEALESLPVRLPRRRGPSEQNGHGRLLDGEP